MLHLRDPIFSLNLHFLCPDHEIGRRRQNDFCRSAGVVRQGGRDLHPRADDESLDPHRGQQETDPATK
jgi:hypothetical protein